MALLPSFFILQSGSKYLSLTENVPPGLPTGFVKFEDEQIWSPRVKFAAEPAETGDGRFVHIRSLYNNKYLVKKQIDEESNKSWIIVASGKKPEEDASKDSCTLFEPCSEADQPTRVRLRHVSIDDEKKHKFVDVTVANDDRQPAASVVLLRRHVVIDEKNHTPVHVTLSSSSVDVAKKQGMLQLAIASSSNSNGSSVFSVIDGESLVVLPWNACIIYKGLYLRSTSQGHNYEAFGTPSAPDEPAVYKQLTPNNDGSGTYCIWDACWGRFLKYHTTWIWADANGSEEGSDLTRFQFVQIKDNIFGVRSMANNRYCGPLTMDGKVNCLNAYFTTLSENSFLTVEEHIREKQVLDIQYRVSDARIYGEKLIEIDTQTATNLSSEEASQTLWFKETNSITRYWCNSMTIHFGVTVSMTVSEIPFIDESSISFTTDYTDTHTWSETEKLTTSRGTSTTVPVPPGTTVKVTLMATTAKCDVPFNYTERNLLYNTSDWVEHKRQDGVYSGVNSFNFYYKIEEI